MLVGALLIALTLVWNTITAMQRNYHLQQKQDQLAREVELQEIINQNLRYKISYLKTDDYMELASREKFNKTTPGEYLVYLPDSGKAQQAPVAKNTVAAPAPEPTGWQANIKAWLRFLQGNQLEGKA